MNNTKNSQMAARSKLLVTTLLLIILSTLFTSGIGLDGATLTIVNKCDHTVWPGIESNSGEPTLFPVTGFTLQKGENRTLITPDSWNGRIWGRTLCTQDSAGNFSCVTGDCGSGKVECSGGGPTAATTLAEFSLGGNARQDFFDVSLVSGFNLPMVVVPLGNNSSKNCSSTGCAVDLNNACPSELRVSGGVACNSACVAFKEPRYCCTGAYSSPATCKPTSYSRLFKTACPQAYSYSYNDESSTFTCPHSDYLITFCPLRNTTGSTTDSVPPPPPPSTSNVPHTDTSIVYKGASPSQKSGASPYRCPHYLLCLISVSVTMAFWPRASFYCHLEGDEKFFPGN